MTPKPQRCTSCNAVIHGQPIRNARTGAGVCPSCASPADALEQRRKAAADEDLIRDIQQNAIRPDRRR